MSDWVRFHRELREGAKRGLSRAVRFVYLEISSEARKRRGVIPLPAGLGDVDGLHDILGGNRKEVAEAVERLSSAIPGEPEPMIRFEGEPGGRRCVVVAWEKWNPVDATAAERKRKQRSHVHAATADRDCPDGVTRDSHGLDRDSDRDVTELRARAQISSPSSLLSSGSQGESERGAVALEQTVTLDMAITPELTAIAELTCGVQDVSASWRAYCGKRAGRVLNIAGDWQGWCVAWAKNERRDRDRDRGVGGGTARYRQKPSDWDPGEKTRKAEEI